MPALRESADAAAYEDYPSNWFEYHFRIGNEVWGRCRGQVFRDSRRICVRDASGTRFIAGPGMASQISGATIVYKMRAVGSSA